jgi:hypothetical protein
MLNFKRLFLFMGCNTKSWDPFLFGVTNHFFHKKVIYSPKKVILRFNLLLNILWNTLLRKKIVWIIDPEKKIIDIALRHTAVLRQNKVIYITTLPEGFLTNKVSFPIKKKPSLVISLSATKNITLLLDLKKQGIICSGFVDQRLSDLLDYPIYINKQSLDFIYLLFTFILHSFSFLNKKDKKLSYTNYLKWGN